MPETGLKFCLRLRRRLGFRWWIPTWRRGFCAKILGLGLQKPPHRAKKTLPFQSADPPVGDAFTHCRGHKMDITLRFVRTNSAQIASTESFRILLKEIREVLRSSSGNIALRQNKRLWTTKLSPYYMHIIIKPFNFTPLLENIMWILVLKYDRSHRFDCLTL